jgi:hypothetical protein
MVTLKHPPLGPLMLKHPLLGPLLEHPLLGPLLKHPPLGPLLRLRRPTKSESTSSAISSFGATSTYTSLETAVDKGDAADRVGGTPYRICRRQNINQASYDRAGACATTTSAGRPSTSGSKSRPRKTSPLWQRQPPVATPAPRHLRKLAHVCVCGIVWCGVNEAWCGWGGGLG